MQEDLTALLERWPLALQFDLPVDAIIVVVGAYKGIVMDLMDEMYHPKRIYGFEPQPWAAQIAADRLQLKPHCQVYNVALSAGEYGSATMGEWGTDACSLVNTGPAAREHGMAMLQPPNVYFENIPHCDLLIMNIEGYEFSLLPHMRGQEILKKVDRLAVQWHLDLGRDTSRDNMDAMIEDLIVHDEFFLRIDERPAWTYHTKASA